MHRALTILLLIMIRSASAATLSVPSQYSTIQAAANASAAGDTVRVAAGTYNERVALSIDGTSSLWINYVADGAVICRGFDLTTVAYTRIIGFEITHTTTTYSHGIVCNSGCSNIVIADNYIHNVKGQAVRCDQSGNRFITARGNTVFYTDCIYGVYTNYSAYGMTSDQTGGYFLFEYNILQRCADVFLGTFGTNCIARNNYCWDFRDVYWLGDGSTHSDTFQDGSDGQQMKSRNHLYERNMCGDQLESNSHFGIWQDTISAGDTNSLLRGNVVYNFGGGGIGVKGYDKVNSYHDTFYKMCQAVDAAVAVWYENGSDFSLGNICKNMIIADRGLSTDAIYTQAGNSVVFTNILGYLAGSKPFYISTNDPLFVNPASGTRNFHLQASSPAINLGTNVAWVTSADASGTTFNVNDGQLFIDGWGLVDGDTITVGGTTTIISSISGNAVTVANSVTWTNNMPVYWGTDTTPDIGALPYGSIELTAATISKSGTTYTVTPTGDARGVWFYVDGIPTTWDSSAPYSTVVTSGTVTAKAYALYAQAVPVVTAAPGDTFKFALGAGTISLGGGTLQLK